MGKTKSLKLHNISIDATVCRFGVPWVESRLIFMQKIVVELVPLPPHVEAAYELQCHNLKDRNNSSELQIKDGHNNYICIKHGNQNSMEESWQ